jgi:hypothetical protein
MQRIVDLREKVESGAFLLEGIDLFTVLKTGKSFNTEKKG